MESFVQLALLEDVQHKKESMLLKRIKAKQKAAANPVIKIQNKLDVRKERNRCAAQRSRDKRKNYLQNLEQQNMRLKDIISRCQTCSAENDLHADTNQYDSVQRQQMDQIIPITQSPPTFVMEPERYIREDHFSDDSSSHLSKYFWFGCLVILVCMANFQSKGSDVGQRKLFDTALPSVQNSALQNYIGLHSKFTIPGQRQSTTKGIASALMNKQSINYCQKCIECLKNITNQTKGQLSLLGSQINETLNNKSTTTEKILFCKSKAKFFHKIYEALMNPNEKQQKSSRQITRMLVKGKALNQLMQQDCFSEQLLNQEQQYIISFSLAILEMTPVKMSRNSKLSLHHD